MKKSILLTSLFLLSTSLFAQTIGVLNGPSGLTCAKLMENVEQKSAKYSFEKFASAQTELPKLIKGEIDIGFLPPNAAAKVYNANKGALLCLGIAGNGNLYLMTKDESVKSIKDLDGKTISCAGQGATPEYMMKFLMKKNEINAKLDFSTPNPQIATALIEGKFDYALVPEPFATVSETTALKTDSSVIRALNISDEFKKIEKTDFPMTLLVVNANYAKKHKKEIKKFIADFEKASDWTIKNPSDAGKLVEKYELGLKAPIATKAIPNAAYTWKTAKDGKAEIEKLLSIFLENSPESIGEKLPDEKFYY